MTLHNVYSLPVYKLASSAVCIINKRYRCNILLFWRTSNVSFETVHYYAHFVVNWNKSVRAISN